MRNELSERWNSWCRRKWAALCRLPRALLWAIVVVVVVLLAIYGGSFAADNYLTGYLQRTMNQRLVGYQVNLKHAHFQPYGLVMTLNDLVITQKTHPQPPVMVLPVLSFHLLWRDLFHGHVTGDCLLERPELHVNLEQLQAQRQSHVPLHSEGWQNALEAAYPFKIDRLRIHDSNIEYVQNSASQPLVLSHLYLTADNIRNVYSSHQVYPSSYELRSVVFGVGRLKLSGHANFLDNPFPGLRGFYTLEHTPLNYFDPIVAGANLTVRGGIMTSNGFFEYSPRQEVMELTNGLIDNLRMEYIHSAATAPQERRHLSEAKQLAHSAVAKPTLLYRVGTLRIRHSNVAYFDRAATVPYRLYLSDADLTIDNLSNHQDQGTARIDVHGLFMDSGPTQASLVLRPQLNGPDFSLRLAMVRTDLASLSDLFRSYLKVGTKGGTFSVFAEASAKNGYVNGYVKPLFSDIEVGQNPPPKKGIVHHLYKDVVQGVADLLKNGQGKVATQTSLSGPIGQPRTSTWQAILNLLSNAFYRAILPGFDRARAALP